jgi:hypothetical protein
VFLKQKPKNSKNNLLKPELLSKLNNFDPKLRQRLIFQVWLVAFSSPAFYCL